LKRAILAGSVIVTITLLIITGSSDTAFGVPVFPSGEQTVEFDGHCYAYIDTVSLNYGQAFVDAQTKSVNGIPGHLATYSSGDEEAASDSTAAGGISQRGWIGFTQDPTYYGDAGELDDGTFGEAGWGWVTGEPVVYSNWNAGEPNDGGGTEDYAQNNQNAGRWNDRNFFGNSQIGYYVEFDVLCSPVTVTIPVDIDIKPGSDPNSINTKSMGVVPVAILGSVDFDVTTVDVTTLAFGPDGASPKHDLTDPDTYDEHLQDVNGDGFLDLVSHYKQKETGIACGDTEAILTAATNDGTTIEGTDSVNPKCKP